VFRRGGHEGGKQQLRQDANRRVIIARLLGYRERHDTPPAMPRPQ